MRPILKLALRISCCVTVITTSLLSHLIFNEYQFARCRAVNEYGMASADMFRIPVVWVTFQAAVRCHVKLKLCCRRQNNKRAFNKQFRATTQKISEGECMSVEQIGRDPSKHQP